MFRKKFRNPVGDCPDAMAITPDGKTVYAAG
jgi:DNA-binding beta-propeller fold protein YncE